MSVPARVHIILAREARTALILRRGPSKAVCAIGWDRKTDIFTVGQWLRGRIHERRCDLSPDGRHFIYLAMNGKWHSEAQGAWTAISRAPHLKAIGLWAAGDCWNGGGLFMDNRAYWLNVSRCGQEERLIPSALVPHHAFPFHESYGGECPGVYYIRLQRDGWKLVGHGRLGRHIFTLFEKELPNGWILRKTAHETNRAPVGSGSCHDTHSLHDQDGSPADIDCADWEWADLDGLRLVWVAKGILHAAGLRTGRLIRARPLYDFNPLKFEAIQAPY